MITTISKTFDFDAAHRLTALPKTHKCYRMHGHTYRVELQLRGEPDGFGMLVDYAVIEEAWRPLHAVLDHRVLNEINGLAHPTTEVLAAWIWERLFKGIDWQRATLHRVRVYESSTTWAEVGE